jgi:2',3'-cyclic-nucleotide 2'-phosphodiesterase (5'-nucleotidase family)
MISKLTHSFLFLPLFLLLSCGTKYQLVKSNRDEYQINQQVGVDSAIVKTYSPYKIALAAEMNKVIGYTDVVLTKASTAPESVLGNFFADAVFNQAKKIEPKIDFAFPTTRGGIRNDVPKGPITVAQLFEMMPFENQLVLFELKGSDVKLVLNYIAATNGQPVAGITMNIKDNQPTDVKINGTNFDINRTYKVLTSDYIANGGDDSQGFSNPITRRNIGLMVRDALLKEVAAIQAEGKKINTKLDGRITKN